ncbi:nagb/rpia/CoA transferase-like protein [Serendipita vermifera]|nr:nagb/rpia/CoA transferase-like protein [Serendipita vermifera]
MTTIKSAKSLLRKNMKQKLASISPESLSAQSLAVTKSVLEHQVYKNSKTVACYLSMSTGEIQTDRIVHSILADVPNSSATSGTKTTRAPTSYMDFFKVHSVDDFEKNLVSGVWGIREPSELYQGQKRTSGIDGLEETIDLILLPGMAFDRSLARLGHGKGYYDKFITDYRQLLSTLSTSNTSTTSPLAIGLSLEEQIVEDETIPMTETDVYLDGLITPTGTVPPSRSNPLTTPSQ